jgi:hypothetical protein
MKITDEIISKVLNSENKYLFLTSLISSDNILNKEDAIESLEIVKYINDNIDNLDLTSEIKSGVIRYMNKAKKILDKDIKRFDKK